MQKFKLPELLWSPSPNFSSRGGSKVRLIVVHDCEGSESGSISWFAQSRSRVSAHGVLSSDGARLTRMVEWENKAWHAKDFNSASEGIEMAGFAAKGFGDPEWDAMASVVAWRLRARGLSPKWAQHGEGEGFCSHYDLGPAGGGHSDPTTDTGVWSQFCALVEAAYEEMGGGHVPTLTQTLPPPAPVGWKPHPSVRRDFEAGSLEWAQSELNALGFAKPALSVDGLYGPATYRALRSFQLAKGLDPDGVLGPKTTEVIERFANAQIAAHQA